MKVEIDDDHLLGIAFLVLLAVVAVVAIALNAGCAP